MSDTAEDLNIFKSLWENINDVCAPPPPPGEPAKACFLMELPGFSIDPDAFDVSKFKTTELSPDHATALLCDRIPAIARYYYDTGNRISTFWEMLLKNFRIEPDPTGGASHLEQAYEKAIKMLYGSKDNYVNGVKTKFYSLVDTLREEYEAEVKKDTDFRNECQQKKDDWPENYERGVAPIKDSVQSAFTRYNNQRMQVQRYEAAIYAYAAGDLSTRVLQAADSMELQKRFGAGADTSPYYPVTVQPSNWWTWFKTGDDKPSDEGWTEVTITQTHKYEAAHDTYSNVSAEAGASYGGLFYHGGGSGGFDRKAGNSSLTKKGSNFSLTFKVRKVIINRSWMDPSLLLYTTIGIKGIPVGAWSSGELSATQNHGTFPLVPTAFVVAKDVTLKAESYSDYAEQSFKDMSAHAAFKVGIGPFSANGNFSTASGSKDSSSKYDDSKKTLTINGAQIIGWVCTANPHFPQYSVDYKQNPKDPNSPAYENPNLIQFSAPAKFSAQPYSAKSYGAPSYGAPSYGVPPQFGAPAQFPAQPKIDYTGMSYLRF